MSTEVRGMAIGEVRFGTVDGVRIRYADSGGTRTPVLLLTSSRGRGRTTSGRRRAGSPARADYLAPMEYAAIILDAIGGHP